MGINQTQIDYKWQSSYRKLIKLRSMYPRDYFNETINGNHNPLFSWCNAQRRNKERLSPKHLFQLQQIDFPWQLETKAKIRIDIWEENFSKLEELKNDNQLTWLDEYINEEVNPMYIWIRNQRKNRSKLSQERQDKLNKIGFRWTNHEQDKLVKWNKDFLLYVNFFEDNKTAENPFPKIRKNSLLDKWCIYQREHKEELSDDQKKRLDKVGFEWRSNEEVKNEEWEKNFDVLADYIKNNNNMLPAETEEDSNLLYLKFWYKYQLVNKDSLNEEQFEKLQILKNRHKKKVVVNELELEF